MKVNTIKTKLKLEAINCTHHYYYYKPSVKFLEFLNIFVMLRRDVITFASQLDKTALLSPVRSSDVIPLTTQLHKTVLLSCATSYDLIRA
jgi:hypothetical protein